MNKRHLFLAAVLLFTQIYVSAQPMNPDSPVPLDGGLLALLAAGAAYGIKKTLRSSDE
jgi:hypothetical protein